MTSPFCLLPQYADRFRDKVDSGELSAEVLAAMSSAERHTAFSEIVGEANATHVNASFESKLLLKNQQAGITRWIENAKDLKPAVRRDLLARVERMSAVLDPAAHKAFLADLAKQRLGFGVSMEEAGKITAMAKATATAKTAAKFDPVTGIAEAGEAARLAYGRARVEFGNYTSGLKNEVKVPLTVGKALQNTASFAKAFKAAFDNSALFRQGWKTMFAHPGVWARNARQSFTHLVQQFGGKAVMDEVNAEIISRPNAVSGRYQKAKLALANVEEQFPTTLPEKIPLLGRFYKASEAAFTAFQYQTRADIFDKYMEIAERSEGVGSDMRVTENLESVGKLVNSLTARGHLGPLEPSADVLNVAFFSARKLKSDLDLLLLQPLGAGGANGSLNPAKMSFAQKQAAINLVKVASGTAAVLVVAHAVAPGSVDFDPRSSAFGKIKSGRTTFDVTGGMGPLATLVSRLATMSSKSTTTGKVTPINSGKFGATSGTDLVVNFLENKLSPAASIVKDVLKGRDFQGKRVTVAGEVSNLLTPLPITNAQQLLSEPNKTTAIIGILADALGVSTNTLTPRLKKVPR